METLGVLLHLHCISHSNSSSCVLVNSSRSLDQARGYSYNPRMFPGTVSVLRQVPGSTHTSFISEELLSSATRLSTLPDSGRKQGWSGFRIFPSSGMQVSSQVSKKGVSPEGLGSDRITCRHPETQIQSPRVSVPEIQRVSIRDPESQRQRPRETVPQTQRFRDPESKTHSPDGSC